jgi:hypothetical protein
METRLMIAPALPEVSTPLAPVLAAFSGDERVVGALPVEDVTKLFNQLLSRAALLLGHKTWQDGAELYVLARSCAELVHRKFRGLKPAEIALAMDRGAAGEYKAKAEDVVYVQLPAITAWLYAYQTTARHDAIKALRQADEAQQLLLPPPVRDYAAEVVELVRLAAAGSLPPAHALDFANVLYDWLKTLGALHPGYWPVDVPDYDAIRIEEADVLLTAPAPKDKHERRQLSSFLDVLVTGHWPANHPLSRTVANACKKRVLREWVLQYAAEEIDTAAILSSLVTQQQQAA